MARGNRIDICGACQTIGRFVVLGTAHSSAVLLRHGHNSSSVSVVHCYCLFVCSGVLQINCALEEVNCAVTINDSVCPVPFIGVRGIKFCTEYYCLLRC